MRVFVSALHRYPARFGGPSGGHIYDLLVRGLAELGHDVLYFPRKGASAPLPRGVTLVTKPVWDVNIVHCRREETLPRGAESRSLPWVVTCHTDIKIWGIDRKEATDQWIYVSRTLAATFDSNRYIHNGIDPSEFIYSETKSDYYLFVSTLRMAMKKGLDIALRLAKQMGFKLVVAVSGNEQELANQVTTLCKAYGADYVGEIYGTRKGELFAGAKALLFPTQLNEGFGLVMAEALMSGTPVICSLYGACPELISQDVGFVCATEGDYRHAIRHIEDIVPVKCRRKAMREFHYLRMARDYVREYERELGQ